MNKKHIFTCTNLNWVLLEFDPVTVCDWWSRGGVPTGEVEVEQWAESISAFHEAAFLRIWLTTSTVWVCNVHM